MQSKEMPYILFVAEYIYLKICDIKKKNPNFSNSDSIDNFIGSKIYNEISSGEFHDNWFEKLKSNKFIDKKTKKKNSRGNFRAIANPKKYDDKTINSISKLILF